MKPLQAPNPAPNPAPTALFSAVNVPQGEAFAAKAFQLTLIDNLVAALHATPRPPCLLKSPTGSGKTFMLGEVLRRVHEDAPVLWFWFVPYVNLVAQTADALARLEEYELSFRPLKQALNEDAKSGRVLLSTAQGVASAKARNSGYTIGEDDDTLNLAAFKTRVRAAGLCIGVVVDEAHIALKDETEFGQFVRWLKADYLLMATATPRDAALNKFLAVAGFSGFKTFSIERAAVVAARLNKQWLQAVVYNLSTAIRDVADLQRTVLRRAWAQHRQIAATLAAQGVKLTPLLLVQVGNGANTVKEAVETLQRDLSIPLESIATHSADEPDPQMMSTLAFDESREVLVFKQSAGVGFDAPRAFVLASTKPVNDADFALQFIGRVMRVPLILQQAFPESAGVPEELNTAYVFLADARAQAGFTQAAQALAAVKTELDGQVENLVMGRTAQGGVAITNKPSANAPLAYDLASLLDAANAQRPPAPLPPQPALQTLPGGTLDLFASPSMDDADRLEGAAAPRAASPKLPQPASRAELLQSYAERAITTYARKREIDGVTTPLQLKTEEHADALALFNLDIHAVAQAVPITPETLKLAARAAFDKLTEKELRTELFTGWAEERAIQITLDHAALLEDTLDRLADELGLEEEEAEELIIGIARRLMSEIEESWAWANGENAPQAQHLRRLARSAACWVIQRQFAELQETLFAQRASQALETWAENLPDLLIAPAAAVVEPARKNLYGIFFPAQGSIIAARAADWAAMRGAYCNADLSFPASNERCIVAAADATFECNELESQLARALERAPFVLWWHRNPQGKPYSVAITRADSTHMFYPDFVVCLRHMPDEAPLMRLIETKHDVKDAQRKSRHVSRFYGRVLFLTQDGSRYRVVTAAGGLGEVVDFDGLTRLFAWLRETTPPSQYA